MTYPNTLRAALTALGLAVLMMIFQAYLRPGFIIDLTNQLFLCL